MFCNVKIDREEKKGSMGDQAEHGAQNRRRRPAKQPSQRCTAPLQRKIVVISAVSARQDNAAEICSTQQNVCYVCYARVCTRSVSHSGSTGRDRKLRHYLNTHHYVLIS